MLNRIQKKISIIRKLLKYRIENFLNSIYNINSIIKHIIQTTVLFISVFICGQSQKEINSYNNSQYYSLLFYQDSISENQRGTIKIPGDFKALSLNDEVLIVSFENSFEITDPEIECKIIFENGLMDEGMVLINGKYISDNIISEGNPSSYEQIIPKRLIQKGSNTITILALSYSESGYVNGNISIQQNSQELDLFSEWNYKIYTSSQNNLRIIPTQVINVDWFDFNIDNYLYENLDDSAWPTTNFPASVENLYNNKQLDGAFWFVKTIRLEKQPEQDIYFKVPDGIDDYDKLFINGNLIGLTNCYSCPRNYRIPKEYLKQNNVFSLLVIDKDGAGGIRGKISLEGEDMFLDISNDWKYKKIFDLQVLVTIKESSDKLSFFENDEVSIFNLSGRKLNFDNILIENKTNPFIYVVIFLLIVALIYVFYSRKINLKTIDEKVNKTLETVNKSVDYVFIRADRANHKIEIQSILLVEGKKDYVKLHLSENSYLVRKNLKTFLNELPSSKFIRISKSIAVNIDQIKKIDKNMLFLKSGKYYIIGKKYYEEVKQLVV